MKKVIFLLLVLFALTTGYAYAEPEVAHDRSQVYLVVMGLPSTGASFQFFYHEMPSIDRCYEVIRNSAIQIPKSGDAEAVVAMYCSYDTHEYRRTKSED